MVAIMSPSTRSFSAVLVSMVVVVLHQATSVQAVQWFNGTADLPSNVSTSCVTALQADITSCSSSMATIRPFVYPPQDYLTLLCTEDCNAALQSYESGVETACAGQTYNSTADGGYVPMLAIPQLLRYSFNLTCLTDAASGQYCKVLAAAAIGIAANQSNLAAADVDGGDDGSGGCSDCVLKSLQFQASSPFFADNGADDAYTSATSSCSATGYPLTATTALFTATAATATATATASPASCDRTYSIQSDDTCASISKAQEIGTTWLLSDNNLAAYCSSFPTNGSLCLNHSCTTYTVQANDTCQTVESAHNLTLAQVLAWNPQLDLACSNLNMSLGLELCVGSPGTPYTAPNSTANTSGTGSSSGSGTTATAPAAVPDNIANGTNTDCGKYYAVQGGDYCNLLVLRFAISLADFLFLNPDVNSNCTNLYAQESYCVEPVGDIGSYPGYGGVTPIGNLTGTSGSFSSFSNATYIPTLFAGYNRTLANSTVSTCTDYFNGADYQDDLTGTFYASNCALAASVYGITTANLATWNPSLASNATDSSCAFSATAWYCAGYGGDYPDLANDTISDDANATATASATPPAPTQSGEPADCNMWYVAQANDTCSTPEDEYGVSHAQFIAWNPAVSSDCSSGFWVDEAYCVGTASSGADATTTASPASSTPTTSAASATSPTPPAPTQAGEPADCNAWYVAQANDGCATVAEAHGITTDQFLEWNPAVSSDCSSGFWVDEAYCVGTASSSSSSSAATSSVTPTSTTTTSASSTSPASATSPTPPAPTQAGEPSNCNQWFVAESGNSCATATDEYEITMDQFLEWNPAVSSDCVDGFWAGEAYCVGVAAS